MYPQHTSNKGVVEVKPDGVTVTPTIPSRYSGSQAAAPISPFVPPPPRQSNPYIQPHTPFVVYLGLIFAFLIPPVGLAISYVALRLVNSSARGISGQGLAKAGIVIGAVLTMIAFLGVLGG